MNVEVKYYKETQGVLWMDIEYLGYNHRLWGIDYYWYNTNSYGYWTDPDPVTGYVLKKKILCGVEGFVEASDNEVPEDAVVLYGIEIPDEEAIELGIL